ncbi:hypothetical protein [Rubritalea sp.]|uniref:hypothetical protein n=1 Tax=Rubritalea sp. TaxID=2109375 RepID=UPI003EF65515
MLLIFNKVLFTLLLFACAAGEVLTAAEYSGLKQLSLTQLEERASEIDGQLDQLAGCTLRSGVGNLGWLSQSREDPSHPEWVEIDFGEDKVIDLIVMAPIIWNDTSTGPRADGFPEEFKVIVGKNGEREGKVVASFDASDKLLPRIAPLAIPIEPTTAGWVRIEVTKLSKWAWKEGRYLFQLSEVMVFSGLENVALHQFVRVSSRTRDNVAQSMSRGALVDGFMPYLMDAAHGAMSDPYIAFYKGAKKMSFSVDLQHEQHLDGVNLHINDIRENFPKMYHADYGVPKRLVIEGANLPDFSDAALLLNYTRRNIYETGPVIMLNLPETSCRYVRLVSEEGYASPEANNVWRCFGLAEIELLSRGRNVAEGKGVRVNFQNKLSQGEPEALTDGRNHYGKVLPVRDWMEQLALRQELENERPLVSAELDVRYQRQQKLLWVMTWMAAVFAAGIVITVLINRILRMREVARLKQQFAADLHDELGANLHSIGLISDVAEEVESVEEWKELNQRVRRLTERAGTAVRHCTNMLEVPRLSIELPADMRRASQRIMINQQHEIVIEGESYLEQLKPRVRFDVFLFYKECLINICRHSGATSVRTHLSAGKKEIELTVSDNGSGIAFSENEIPSSLQRRADLLKGSLGVASSPEGGTTVSLKMRYRPWLNFASIIRSLKPEIKK